MNPGIPPLRAQHEIEPAQVLRNEGVRFNHFLTKLKEKSLEDQKARRKLIDTFVKVFIWTTIR